MQLEFSMEESRGNQLPGERFCPMEDELLLFYLKPLLSGQKVPGRNILVFDCDLYGRQEPWEIWEDYKNKTSNDLRLNKDIYFFTQLKKMSSTGKRIRRTVGSGTWKENVSDKPVKSCETGHVVGSKKIFSYDNKASVHHKCWILYEFSLDGSLRDKKEKVKDYVLCLLRKNGEPESKIQKKRNEREEEEVLESNYVCNDGIHSNTEKEEFLEPQAKRQHTMPSIEYTPVPLPTPSEDDAFLAQLEETLEPFEDDHSPSSEAEASFQGEQNGGLQRLASEVQAGLSFGDNHEVLYSLPDEDFAIEECLEELANIESEEQNLAVINNTLLHQPPTSTMFAACDDFDMSYLSFQNIGTNSAGSNSVYGGSFGFQNGADLLEPLEHQQLVAEPQPREESLGQQYQMPTISVNEMAGGLDFHQDENLTQQTGGEGPGEVNLYGGYCSDSMLDEMIMSYAEELMNDGLPNSMEVGESEWNAAGYSDF